VDAKTGGSDDRGLNTIGMVAAAVGGGIGVLGFVAFFGAAIVWARMDAAGLPGNEAVAVVPRSVLLSTGANFLVPSLLIALGFAALLFVLNAALSGRAKGVRDLEADLQEKSDLVEVKRKAARDAARQADVEQDQAVKMSKKVEALATDAPGAAAIASLRTAAQERLDKAATRSKQATTELDEADRAQNALQIELVEARAKGRLNARKWERVVRPWAVAGIMVAGAVIAIHELSVEVADGRVAVLGLLVTALIVFCLAVLQYTNFAWFTLAAFVAVGLFSGFTTYYRTIDSPRVEPAAVLRTGGPPVYGFFVAQTSDRVYLGARIGGGVLRMEAIPREEVTDMAVASLEPIREANGRGLRLARQICRLSRERYQPLSAPLPKAVVSRFKPGDTPEPCTWGDLTTLKKASKADRQFAD
jgi:hypothetical protein